MTQVVDDLDGRLLWQFPMEALAPWPRRPCGGLARRALDSDEFSDLQLLDWPGFGSVRVRGS